MRIQRRMINNKYGLGRLAISLFQWAENTRPIKGHDIAGLGRSANKSLSGLRRPIIISLSANAHKLQKCDGQQADMVIPMSPSNSVGGRYQEKRDMPI